MQGDKIQLPTYKMPVQIGRHQAEWLLSLHCSASVELACFSIARVLPDSASLPCHSSKDIQEKTS